MTDPIEIRQVLTRFAYRHNINMVTDWHNKLFIGINEGIGDLEKSLNEADDKSEIKNLKHSIHMYENYISDNLRNFTLIMHLSNFEEISTLICKEMNVTVENRSSISRFQNGWEKKFGKPIGKISSWNILKNAEKIRNGILHSAGRISLNRNKADIVRIIAKEGLKTELDRVYVTEQFLNKVKDAIWEMAQ